MMMVAFSLERIAVIGRVLLLASRVACHGSNTATAGIDGIDAPAARRFEYLHQIASISFAADSFVVVVAVVFFWTVFWAFVGLCHLGAVLAVVGHVVFVVGHGSGCSLVVLLQGR